MADRVTVVEVEMAPSSVMATAERWAEETGFSLHTRTASSVVYRYDRQISTVSWLSIENLGTRGRLSAWLAPKGLGPDEQGSFWKGNKIALPMSFALGPLGRFKKQFNKLLEC
jgi:hypothetical protein